VGSMVPAWAVVVPVRCARCQWKGNASAKPRQVSVLLHPLFVGGEPLLWQDWSRRRHRRACMDLLGHQQVEVQSDQSHPACPDISPSLLSRPRRARYRLSWQERLVAIKLFAVPEGFASFLGLASR
jgi:hypothetical protein